MQGCALCCHILKQIGDRVALGLERCGSPGNAGGGLRIDAGRVIDKVGVKAALPDLLGREIAGELVDDCRDHFHVGEFLRADVGQNALALLIRHGVALIEVAHGRAELAVRSAELCNDDFGNLRIGILDFHRELQTLVI